MNEIKLNRDQADKMIELFRKYENTGSWVNSSLDNFAVAVSSLVVEDEKPYNSDPHEWTEGEHRYFLTTHALRFLPEPTRFVNETDNEIALRKYDDFSDFWQDRYGHGKVAHITSFRHWLEQE